MQEPAAWTVGEQVADRYVVRAALPAGPLGPRYLAHDERTAADVVLRVARAELLPDEESRRAFRERMARSRALSHPGLVRLVEVIQHGGLEVSVVEHAPGPTLDEVAARRGTFTFADARPALGQIAGALTHAHQLGIVLGDLRPGAVVQAGDAARVTSLGVALSLPRERYLGAMAVHPEYPHLAPELRRGGYCDARADVYSFGALAMVLLCGTDLESARAGQRPGVPVSLLSVLERAVDQEPSRRPATIEALLLALDRANEEARPRRGPVTLPPSITRSTGPITLPGTRSEEPPPAARSPTNPSLPAVTPPPAAPPLDVTRQIDQDELRRLAGEVSVILENTRHGQSPFEPAPSLEATRQVDLQQLESLRAQSASDEESVPEPILLSGGRTREPTVRYPVPRREPTGRVVIARIGAATLTTGENVPSRVGRDPTPRGVGGPVPAKLPGRESTPIPRTRRDSTPVMVPAVPPGRPPGAQGTLDDSDEYAAFEVHRGPAAGPRPDDTLDDEEELRVTDVLERSAVAAVQRAADEARQARTARPLEGAAGATTVPEPVQERGSDRTLDTTPADQQVERTAAETPWARRVASASGALPVEDETDFSSLDLDADRRSRRTDELAVTDRMPAVPPAAFTGEPAPAGASPGAGGPPSGRSGSGGFGVVREPVLFAPRPPDPFAEALEAHDALQDGGRVAGASSASTAGARPGAAPFTPSGSTPNPLTPRRAPEGPPIVLTAPTAPTAPRAAAPAEPSPRAAVAAPPAAAPTERPRLLVLDDSDPELSAAGTARPHAEQTPVVVRAAPRPQEGRRTQHVLLGIGLGCLLVAVGAGVAWRRRAPSAATVLPATSIPAAPASASASPPTPPPAAGDPRSPATPASPPAPPAPPAPTAAAPEAAPPSASPAADADGGAPVAEMVEVDQRGKHFFIDAYEFPGKGRLPRVDVSLDEARAACEARRCRLCAASEFELACRGEHRASFPYGSQYEAGVCNTEEGKVEPSGTFSDCRSAAGAFDMSGNVAEWTESGIVKGGAVGGGFAAARCSRDLRGDGKPSPTIGFRCCKDAE